jgi:hypothetical protein
MVKEKKRRRKRKDGGRIEKEIRGRKKNRRG